MWVKAGGLTFPLCCVPNLRYTRVPLSHVRVIPVGVLITKKLPVSCIENGVSESTCGDFPRIRVNWKKLDVPIKWRMAL